MRRVIGIVAAVIAAALCVVGSSAPAPAEDDVLTPDMRQALDASLVVFVGEIAEVGPAPSARSGVRWATYKVERVLKGACFEIGLTVEHSIAPWRDPSGVGLDSSFFVRGRKAVVGCQLAARTPPSYVLQNTGYQFGPVEWTQELEDAIARHAPGAAPPKDPRPGQHSYACMLHLHELVAAHVTEKLENEAKAEKWSGPSLWLRLRRSGVVKSGQEGIFLCPDDPDALSASSEDARKAWDELDLSRPSAGLCSYVGRDFARFPIRVDAARAEPIGACLHHSGIAIVAFDNGNVEVLRLEDLGIKSDAEKVAGPESKSPVLPVLR